MSIENVVENYPWIYLIVLLILSSAARIKFATLVSGFIIEFHHFLQKFNITILWEIQETYGEFALLLMYFIVLTILIKRNALNEVLNPTDPGKIPNHYSREIEISGKIYMFEVGIYHIPLGNHPSLESVVPYKMYEDGTIGRSDYVLRFKQKLTDLIKYVDKYPYLTINLIKHQNSSGLYLPFTIVIYSIIPSNRRVERKIGEITIHQIQRNPKSLNQIMMYDPNFKAVKVKNMSDAQFRQMLKYNPHTTQFLLDTAPSQIRNEYTKYSFQLGIHELDILDEVFANILDMKRHFDSIKGSYYIGNDFRGYPAYCDNPGSILQFGTKEFCNQIINFSFVNNPILLTDDKQLIFALERETEYLVESIGIDKLAIDLIKIKKRYPRAFWLVIHLWEQMLSSTSKNEYRNALLGPKIHSFLEHYEVLTEGGNNQKLQPIDLFSPQTYAKNVTSKQEADLATEVWTKFGGILDMICFNQNEIALENHDEIESLESFVNPDKSQILRIVDLSSLNSKQKYAIISLFLVLKDQSYDPLLPHWIYISLNDESDFQERYLAELRQSVEFQQTIFHLRTIGHLSNWVHGFGMYVCEPNILEARLQDYFFPEYPKISEGLLVNIGHTSYSILQENRMEVFYN